MCSSQSTNGRAPNVQVDVSGPTSCTLVSRRESRREGSGPPSMPQLVNPQATIRITELATSSGHYVTQP
jgi:hypothetical protein